MSGEDYEIEYLDEDEDLIQDMIQNKSSEVRNEDDDFENSTSPLLVERKFERKRKKKVEKLIEPEDSDYDPTEDRESPPPRKRKRTPAKKTSKVTIEKSTLVSKSVVIKPVPIRKVKKEEPPIDELLERRKMNIQIPDYEDPLCLPVRAFYKNYDSDMRYLKHWNDICLEGFKKSDQLMKPQEGKTTASSRTVVIKTNKRKDGKIETTVYGKTFVENEHGVKKVETYQAVLPQFRERKMVNYKLDPAVPKVFKHTYNVLLTKEDHKDEDMLVVYKPQDKLSLVYKLLGQRNSDIDNEDLEDGNDDKDNKMTLKEVVAAKMCAPCYQTSWRGIQRTDKKDTNIECVICSRSFVSVYNMLSHLRTHHSHADVRRHAFPISKVLASVVDYHYRCRICYQNFTSIKNLRKHVSRHKGTVQFKCEVGDHLTT